MIGSDILIVMAIVLGIWASKAIDKLKVKN